MPRATPESLSHGKSRRVATSFFTWASVAALVLALAALAASYLSNSGIGTFLFGADVLQTPAVFRDVFERGGSFLDWKIAPAPAIVPEYGMFAVAYLIGGSYYGRILAYALIQVIVFWAAIYGVSRAAGFRKPLVNASLTVSVAGLLCILGVMDFQQLVQSAFHFGGFILQIVSVGIILLVWLRVKSLSRPKIAALLIVLAFLVLLGSLNDALFVVQLAVPVCFITLIAILFRRISWKSGGLLILTVAASALVGWKLYSRVIPNPIGVGGTLDLASAPEELGGIPESWAHQLAQNPPLVLLLALNVALGILSAILLILRRKVVWLPDTPVQVLAVFGLLSGVFPVLAAFITSAEPSSRYVLPLYYWPCILLPIVLTQLVWKRAVLVATSLACVFSLSSAGIAGSQVIENGLHDNYYPSWIACVDNAAKEFNVKHAVSQYWTAKRVQEISQTGLTVSQVQGNLSQRLWASSRANVYPSYEAFIDSVAKPHNDIRRNLIKLAGDPIAEVDCKKVTVTIWKPGSIVLSNK